jgi:uncharacterized membrane protein
VALHTVAQRTRRPDYHRVIGQQADLALAAAEENITASYELEQIQQRYKELRADLVG